VMILGIMALIGATLTLPGIAGFVLTIGAAVDANVLINERIREEARRGRGVIQTVEIGYKEASRAIFDANITNVISAAIMFVFGSGPIRGFAVVLAIGIATSVFTGVTCWWRSGLSATGRRRSRYERRPSPRRSPSACRRTCHPAISPEHVLRQAQHVRGVLECVR
jgi:preprotein translocase subunit SecD